MTQIREEAILALGQLMYWFLKVSTQVCWTTLETLLYIYVTWNRPAISHIVPWFVMYHKKIGTCFHEPLSGLPNGFPTGSTPVPFTFLTNIAKVVLFIRKWLKFINGKEGYCLFEILMIPIQASPGTQCCHRKHGQIIIFLCKVKCASIIQQNFKHHCKFGSHVCCCQAISSHGIPGKK